MRGKLAKNLRRHAERLTVRAPLMGLKEDYPNMRLYQLPTGEQKPHKITGTMRMIPLCTRAVYKKLKKHAKAI